MRTGVRGQCYCGEVQYEISFPTEFCSHCHCEDCRRSHGAGYVTWTAVPKGQFRLLAGESSLKQYESEPSIRWGFFGRCGTSLLYDSDPAEKIYMTVANLLGPLDREPDSHVSFEEHASWADVGDHLPRYRGKSDERI
ncbi:MAG: GFA family protein [Bdellovibrionota bacterium]